MNTKRCIADYVWECECLSREEKANLRNYIHARQRDFFRMLVKEGPSLCPHRRCRPVPEPAGR